MNVECDGDGDSFALTGFLKGSLQHLAMAEMHTIKHADRRADGSTVGG